MLMKNQKQVDRRLKARVDWTMDHRLLRRSNPEDPNRCELHRFILTKLRRFQPSKRKQEWMRKANTLRRKFLKEVYLKGLPISLLKAEPNVEWRGTIETGKGYRIRKLRYEGYPGMWVPALLYEPIGLKNKVPGVLNPNGHHAGGKAEVHKQARCINLAKRGMLALSTEFVGMGELTMNREHNRIGHMDLCGVAGVSVFYLAMKRALDVLLAHRYCDSDRVAMTGLSGGGWQTVVLGALDQRVKVLVPVAGHSPVWQRVSCMADIGDLEQIPVDLCTVADFDTMTALFAPRPVLLIYNLRDDCCFRSRRTRQSIYRPVKPLYEMLGVGDHFKFYENINPGTHNYEADNRGQLYRFLNHHFGLDTPEEDLPFHEELLSESQLWVGLPYENATQISLAFGAAKELPRVGIPKGSVKQKTIWIRKARFRLKSVIHFSRFDIRNEEVSKRGIVREHRLHLGKFWTVPVTAFEGTGEAHLLLSDGGRSSLKNDVMRSISLGSSVLAADLYGAGESQVPSRLQMPLSAVGNRPLGILVGQILALTRWAALNHRSQNLRVSGIGPVISFAVLCAAALEPRQFSHLYLQGMYDSLKRLIDLAIPYDSAVPLFCFGLLKEVDVPELLAMTEGLSIEWEGRGPVHPVVRC